MYICSKYRIVSLVILTVSVYAGSQEHKDCRKRRY